MESKFKSQPPAPHWLMGSKISGAIEETANSRGLPVELVMGAFLMLPPICSGNACSVHYDKDWKERANIFLVMADESGVEKSTVEKLVFRPLLKREAAIKTAYMQACEQFRTDLMEWKRDRKSERSERPKPPRNRQFFLSDSTPEAAIELLKDNPRGLTWNLDEGAFFWRRLDRHNDNSAHIRAQILAAWSSQPVYAPGKKDDGRSIEIPEATFSLMAMVRPKMIRKLFSRPDKDQGWLPFFLIMRVALQKPIVYPLKEVSRETEELIEKITGRLLTLGDLGEDRKSGTDAPDCGSDENSETIPGASELPTDFYFSSEAKKRLDQIMPIRNFLTFGTPGQGFARKANSMTVRLALIIHLLRWAADPETELCAEIDLKTVEAASQLMEWYLANAAYILGLAPQVDNGSDDSATIKRVATVIAAHRSEIERAREFVYHKVWKKWMADSDISLSDSAMNKIMNQIGSVRIRRDAGYGRKFSQECLDCCEALSEKQTAAAGNSE